MHAPGGAYSAYWKSLSPRARRRNLAVLRRTRDDDPCAIAATGSSN